MMITLVAPKCSHPHIHFSQQGTYLKCCKCGRRWVAVMKDTLSIPDFHSVESHIPEDDVRSSPFSLVDKH